jgi:hypothetical protein
VHVSALLSDPSHHVFTNFASGISIFQDLCCLAGGASESECNSLNGSHW